MQVNKVLGEGDACSSWDDESILTCIEGLAFAKDYRPDPSASCFVGSWNVVFQESSCCFNEIV